MRRGVYSLASKWQCSKLLAFNKNNNYTKLHSIGPGPARLYLVPQTKTHTFFPPRNTPNQTRHPLNPSPYEFPKLPLPYYSDPQITLPTLTLYKTTLPPPPIVLPFSFSRSKINFCNPLSVCVFDFQELALPQEILEDSRSKGVVTALYEALNRRDAEAIQQILAPDLEWWFHGPPSHQYLTRLLTGEKESDSFRFVPHSVSAFGPTVLAEGFDQARSVAWVHAWTVSDGIITQVREYFNTSLTVTRFGETDRSGCIAGLRCPSVWVSSLPDRVGKSVPGLVLAI